MSYVSVPTVLEARYPHLRMYEQTFVRLQAPQPSGLDRKLDPQGTCQSSISHARRARLFAATMYLLNYQKEVGRYNNTRPFYCFKLGICPSQYHRIFVKMTSLYYMRRRWPILPTSKCRKKRGMAKQTTGLGRVCAIFSVPSSATTSLSPSTAVDAHRARKPSC